MMNAMTKLGRQVARSYRLHDQLVTARRTERELDKALASLSRPPSQQYMMGQALLQTFGGPPTLGQPENGQPMSVKAPSSLPWKNLGKGKGKTK